MDVPVMNVREVGMFVRYQPVLVLMDVGLLVVPGEFVFVLMVCIMAMGVAMG